jgi:vacuolar protein sorting-associated protein 13A/C
MARVETVTTAPFTLRTAHATLLQLGNKLGGIYVECQTSTSETLVTLSPYKRGVAPAQLINHTKTYVIEYSEKDNQGRHFLAPGESVYFTWLLPQGSRNLIWSISGSDEEYTNALLSDDRGIVTTGTNRFLSWVSFLDGMQRVMVKNTRFVYY